MDLFAELAISTPGSIVFKATLVLAAGLIATACARRARASVRHAMLTATLAVALALPVGAFVLPAIVIEVPVAGAATRTTSPTEAPQPRSATPVELSSIARRSPDASITSSNVIMSAWAVVAGLLLASLALSVWRLRTIRRTGMPWLESRPLLSGLAARAGIDRRVDVLVHESISAPLTCGILRPAILLSPDTREWSDDSVRRALVHELEHIRRRDWWTYLAARAVCAAYWFHPLAWVTYRQLTLEAERACDDAVVEREETTQYAEQLVQLARRMGSARQQPTLAMANRSDLSARVTALLDAEQSRGRAGFARAALVTGVAALTLVSLAPVRMIAVRSLSGSPAEEQRRDRVSRIDRALVQAAADGDTEDVNSLLASGANLNAAVDGDGSPLIAAARHGHLSLVTMLLDRGADPNLAVRGDGNALIMAAREGHVDIVTLLLDRGANIDDVVDGDENALIQASGHGALEVVKLLVGRGADLNARVFVEDGYGRPGGEWRTPLRVAERGGHRAVVEFLKSAGAR
jgi:beta-lactamase regulating signal transducer with metallopeptidase domain